jgi:hypothetical protein
MAVKESVEYVFPDPNTEFGEPNPADWMSSGNITFQPVEGRGLLLQDNGSDHFLEYSHGSSHLGTPTNVGNFRCLVEIPQQVDAAFSAGGLIGFEAVMDDLQRRLVLRLGKDAAGARVLVIQGATGVPPIPFQWDGQGRQSEFELGKTASGEYFISATNVNDPDFVPVTRTIAAASLPPTNGSAEFLWGMAAEGGGNVFWQEAGGEVFDNPQVDINFNIRRLELDLREAEVTLRGEICLPAGATITPATDATSVKIFNAAGIPLEYTIAAGGFKPKKKRQFRFESAAGTSPDVTARLTQRRHGGFRFRFTAELPSLTVTDQNSMTVRVSFGNKVGSETVALTQRHDRLVYVRRGFDNDND